MKELQKVNWYKIIIFYFSILIITFLSRKLPNLFQIIVPLFTEVHLPWNFNHGIAILIVSILFYKFYTDEKSKISFLGNQKVKALLQLFYLQAILFMDSKTTKELMNIFGHLYFVS